MREGGVYGVLGANGVGKTTLLHLMGGLVFPKSGTIEVRGRMPKHREPDFLADVFYVPLSFDLPRLRVNIYKNHYARFYPDFSEDTWRRALREFDIEPEVYLHTLSFGQKKKVLLGFAIASGCRLLLLDEPTDGLDIPSKDSFRRLLSGYMSEQRLAVITTHHVHDVEMLLDHLVILKGQHVMFQSSISHLSERFYTVVELQLPISDGLLYSERVPGGHHCLLRQTGGREGPLDLEILYKAVQMHPEIFQPTANHA